MQSLSENSIPSKKTAVQSRLSAYLNVEAQSLEELASWCSNPNLPETGTQLMLAFKEELKQALGQPGTVTPDLYERWTDDSSYETQEEVQQRLQAIWDACFG